MARKKKTDIPHFYDKDVEAAVNSIIIDQYQQARRDGKTLYAEFESIIDMLECRRTEKEYEWMSDVFLPEYPSIHLTEASAWANQYFQTRDFVDVYLQSDSPGAKQRAEATRRLINNMLNIREIYHYQKYMRARSINSTMGYCLAICYWERKTKPKVLGYKTNRVIADEDEEGMPIYKDEQQPVMGEDIVVDRFNYEVVDPRNVYTDSRYVYSLQQKEWITIRSELTYNELKEREIENGYINLDLLKNYEPDDETQTKKDTRKGGLSVKKQIKYFDVLESYRKIWVLVTQKDEDGYPLSITPGYDSKGNILDDAEFLDSVVTTVECGDQNVLIRFQPLATRTPAGEPYRPLIRGLCYIHPTSDIGMSDGKYSRELQVALNDTINISNDRVKLATFPTLKVRRYALEDNDTIFFEPEHPMVVEEEGDITEFKIQDNIQGAMTQASLFVQKMQQVNAIYPTTMGDLAGIKSSTTATAVAGAESRTNLRSNYKALTFEYTFLLDFYWMIQQMTYQFMHPSTAMKLMGEYAKYFDPTSDYSFKPVTSNIEVEHSKDKKLQRYDQLLARIANIPNPAVVPIIAHIIGRECVLLGEEYSDVEKLVMKLAQTPNMQDGMPMQAQIMGGQGAPQMPSEAPPPEQNQMGHIMSALEQYSREGM